MKKIDEIADSIGQYFELAVVFVRKLIPLNLTVSQVKDLTQNKEHPFWLAFNEATSLLVPKPPETQELQPEAVNALLGWKAFYKKFFGMDADFSAIRIPAKIAGFDRLIVIAKGVSINQVYETGKKHFGSWKWCDGDVESVMRPEERGPAKETYAIWVRDIQEATDADEDLNSVSAAIIAERKLDTENLLERLIHGFKFWSEKKEHLDIKSVTLCASSRYSDDGVPRVDRGLGGDVNVCRYVVQGSDPCIRARRAVR